METRVIVTIFAITLAASLLLTKMLIPYFRNKQMGQYIREEGPKAHLSKEGTPTMGGLAIIGAVIIGMISTGAFTADKIAVILTMLAFGAIGFLDDYEKIAKKNNLGLTPKQKIILQFVFSLALGFYMMYQGTEGTMVFIPFAHKWVDFGWLFLPFVVFVEIAMSNSVNLTDGLDGLASGVTSIVAFTFAMVGVSISNPDMTVSGLIITAALLGFLVFNRYPAKIFMGDTGSMALGGALSAISIVSGMEFLIPIAGLVYVIEALSVIIQVRYFKKTGGKRFFRMAPIHHHFELGGMKEYNVVLMFCAFTAVCCFIAYFSAV